MTGVTPISVLRDNVNDDSVRITKWLVPERAIVEKGQSIVEVETSKANMEIAAPASGFLRYAFHEGEDVEIGKALGYICEQAESHLPNTSVLVESSASEDFDQAPVQAVKSSKNAAPAAEMLALTDAGKQSTRFTQQAQKLVDEWGLDPSQFKDVGLVRSQDVLKRVHEEMARKKDLISSKISEDLTAGPVAASGVTFRTERLPRSKHLERKYLWSAYRNTLPSTVTVRCNAESVHATAEKETGNRIEVTALIIFEVARLLRKYPIFNAYYSAGCVNYYEEINIGFALDAGRGLIVPVIRDADKKTASEIAEEMREFLVQYLSNEISALSLMGGTFTITDLSSDGVYSFQPLINQGQSAILAVCSDSQSVATQEELLNLILVFDHQLSEGRQAARFLNELRQRVGGNGIGLREAPGLKENLASPRTPTETLLAGIWGEVFGVEHVGLHDSFLELGGHSLLATKLILRVQEATQVELPLRCLFEAPTVARLAAAIEKRKGGSSDHVPLPVIVPLPQCRFDPFPLTDIQQAYWIGRGDSLELGNVACHIYSEVEFADFDSERFNLTLQRLIERHDMLRAIVLADGRQQILEKVPHYNVAVLDLRGQDPQAAASQLEAVRSHMSHDVLPSDKWPLFEVRACLLQDRLARLHISLDLLILDARSIQILIQEFAELYRNPDASLPPLEITFRDYVQTETEFQRSDVYRRAREYWNARLSLLPPAPELPLAKNPSAVSQPRFVRRTARLEPEMWHRLKARATQAGLTAPSVLLAAFAEVLSVWSKSPKFTLNLTLFNRLPIHKQVNDIVGDFTSLNMLAVDNSEPEVFEVRARRLQQQLWSDLDHRNFTGIRVLRELARIYGESLRTTMPVVFTSFLNLDTSRHDGKIHSPLGQITYGITQTPQVWLDNIVREDAGALLSNWDAVEELFPEGFLDDIFNSYKALLGQLASDDASWNRNVADNARKLIPKAQIELHQHINNTEAPLPCEMLHTLFLRQVSDRPNKIAVSTPTRELTYQEVYGLACHIEEHLLHRGIKPNQLIAVVMEKGWEQIVAVLGIHFAGGAYLPIDAELPAERLRYLIGHGQVKVVLTQSTMQDRLSVLPGIEVLAVDRLRPGDPGEPVPRRRQKPEDLAYVIYTSGSTGLPKGVMIDHRGATNTVVDVNRRFNVGPDDRVLALSRLSFDLSVYDIFGLLAAGGTVVMPSADLAQDAAHWMQLISSEKVTIWNTVPALMQLLIDQVGDSNALGQSLRLIMMSGDWIPVSLPGQIRRVLPNAKIISLGGATEASIWSILYPIERIDPDWKSVPYGKPMVNQTFHVLNQMQAPCPAWVPGQLYIGGTGLAKGYWRDEQKTESSFIRDPKSGLRLYRTGDLGRYLPDGNIEFLGREDLQVKVQGYRIELGEIEARLQEHSAIENCVLAVREDTPGEKRLVGYAIVKPGVPLEPAALREFLGLRLPEYMVPSAFVFLDRFPLTPNGKVDRKALPAPVCTISRTTSKTSSPRDTLELQLAKLWEKALGVHPVNLGDNFFDLGGNSLMAVRLFSELRKITGLNLPLSVLLQGPTVERLADILRQRGWTHSWSSLVPIQPRGSKPPFFCVHGAGGNVLLFRDLARCLGSDYPFYGLQSRGLDGSKDYLRTVEDMAAHYLREIEELQPEGPYYLGGFCLGGQVAYEMAQRLLKHGKQVALLVMIDTHNFHGVRLRLSFRESVTHAKEKITFHSVNILRLSWKEQLAYLGKKLQGVCEREVERFCVKVSSFLKKSALGSRSKLSDVFLETINEDAAFSYIPQLYPQNITVFKPRRQYAHLRDPHMGWHGLASGGIEMIELPVNPGGIFVEPYVQTLAEKLRARIDEAIFNEEDRAKTD